MLSAGDEASHRQPMQSVSLSEVGEKQLMTAQRSSEVALGKGGRRHRQTNMRRQQKLHLEGMQENVAMKKELLCKVEEEEVEFGRTGSKDMNPANEGDVETFRQDSYEDNSIMMESKSKQEESGKQDGVMVKSNQPLLLHRAPRYSQS